MRLRLALGALGVLLGLFGLFRLLTDIPIDDLVYVAIWLAGALLIHDGILSPFVVGVGYAISKVVPPRARRYLQPAMVVGALVTVIALPLIYREGTLPKNKAILRQNYGGNLTVLLGIIAAVTLGLYAIRVARDRGTQRPSAANALPPEDHSSSSP